MPTTTINLDAAWREHDRLAARIKRGQGQVFTPRALALRLAAATLGPLDDAPRLIDPACGCGALLLGALEYASLDRPGWLEHWQQGGLTGVDADAACVGAAGQVLGHALPGIRLDLRHADAMEMATDDRWQVVLANPPWVSFSGRQASRLSAARRDGLARRYAAFAGWPSLHAAFCELAGNLAGEQGRIGLLLPMPVAELAGYAAARQALQRGRRLESLVELGEDAFAGVTEPAGMFVLGPGVNTASDWRPDCVAGAAALARRFAPLPPESFGDIGIHSGNAADLLFARRPGPALVPVRVGADVRPFVLQAPSLWLSGAALPPGRYARVPGTPCLARASILLRQTADRPVAARHAPAAAFRNSVLACFGAPGHDDDYLVGVLNSDTLAAIHRALHRDARQRAFPQLKVGHLRALPVPGPEIGPLYDAIAAASRARDHAAVNALVAQAFDQR